MQDIVDRIALCVERGKVDRTSRFPPDMKDQDGAEEVTAEALRNGLAAEALLEGCMTGMDRIGQRFAENDAFVPDLLMAAKAFDAVMRHLEPVMTSGAAVAKGTLVIGTVFGDLHDIGKNLVSLTVKGGGFAVVDLGVNVSAQQVLDAIAEHPGSFVGLSALLTTTMANMAATVKAIKEAHPDTKVLVGGAPITEAFCKKIGADFYSPTPHAAVEFLKSGVA